LRRWGAPDNAKAVHVQARRLPRRYRQEGGGGGQDEGR
jgi:hypothetical protein